MRRLGTLGCVLILMIHFSGCAVVTVLKHPSKKDLNLLTAGTTREVVIENFGAPENSETINGKQVEIYQFHQGVGKVSKSIRAVFHLCADVVTIFLWEFVAWPAENAFDGKRMRAEVTFGVDNTVESAQVTKNE